MIVAALAVGFFVFGDSGSGGSAGGSAGGSSGGGSAGGSGGSSSPRGIDFWPRSAPDDETVDTSLWEFSLYDIGENEAILSVSPSGRHILTAERLSIDIASRFASGIPNHMGRQVAYISVYTERNGVYALTSRIDIGSEADPALNDTLAVSDINSIAWSGDETRALISVGLTTARQYFSHTHSDVFLADFTNQTFENLTGNAWSGNLGDGTPHNLSPQWADRDNIRFIRYEPNEHRDYVISLMGMDLSTGRQELLSDLSDGGRFTLVFDYAIHGDLVYFTTIGSLDSSGFLSSRLDGGRTPPTRLVSVINLRENNIHGYMTGFASVEISQDGRWACLTAMDPRLYARDIPFADGINVARMLLDSNASQQELEEAALTLSQPDPGSAVSMVTRLPWIPCHNVFLYDLRNDELVNPFTAAALQPVTVIVTAATFAPDGRSLLCAVLGDGGEWTVEGFFAETTFYQVRLDDGSFDAVRIFRTDMTAIALPESLTWLGNNSVLIRPFYGAPPFEPVQIATPAAFARFVG
jgi:hypothetical protein